MPWPATLNLKLQGHTQKCSDQNDETQHDHVDDRGIDDDAPDDVAGNQKLKAEDDRSTKILSKRAIAIADAIRPAKRGAHHGDDSTDCDDQDPDAVKRQSDHAHDIAKSGNHASSP